MAGTAATADIAAADVVEPTVSTDEVAVSAQGEGSLRSISRTVRVDIDKLDELMNIVGELVLSKGAFAEIGERLKATGRDDVLRALQKATRELGRRLEELLV